MTTTVADIIRVMEKIAPPQLAESWDNSGLQVGDGGWPVRKILVSLDPSPAVIKHAVEASVDMLITHHPLVFRPLKSVDLSTPIGRIIGTAIRNTISVYAAHTNLDSVVDGLNDMLAQRLGLKHVSVLDAHDEGPPDGDVGAGKNGLGRIGDLPEATDLRSLCLVLKKVLDIDNVRLAGDMHRRVQRVALCTGSGGSLLEQFYSSDADVFITGDVRYHDARDAEDRQAALIDIGHYGSEHIMVADLGKRLMQIMENKYPEVAVQTCEVEKDPFVVI